MRKRLRALVVVALAAATVVTLQSYAAPRSLPPVPKAHFISPAKQDVQSLELAGNSRGDATLLWTEWAAYGHTRLWVRTKRAGGAWGRPHALSGVHVSAVESHAAVGEDGTQLVTWLELARATTKLKVAARRPDGSFGERTLSSGRKPASTIYTGTATQLAVARDGTAVLVGVGEAHRTQQVVAAVRTRNGHWSKQEVVTSGKRGVRYPVVAFDGAGTATLAWERGPREYPDNGAPRVKQEIRVAVRPPGGRFGKPHRVTKPAEDARDAALAVNARGDAVLMWNATHGRNLPGSRIGVAMRAAGGQFGPPRLITPPGSAFRPRAAIGPDGELVAVWSKGYTLVGARGSVGEGLGATRRLSPRGQEGPSVAADPQGNVFATWLLFDDDQFGARVQGRFVGSDGSLGPLVRLAPRRDNDYQQALLDPDGTALAAWVTIRHARGRIEAVRTRVRP